MESQRAALTVDWESGVSGWTDQSGQPPTLISDPTSPSGAMVQQITRTGNGYFSPLINVVGGQPYCLRAKIKWVSGEAPFVGIDRYANGASVHLSWLIGSPYADDLGPTVGVSSVVAGWQDLKRSFVIPADTTQVRITDQLAAGTSKGGDPLAYVDGISLETGACPTSHSGLPYKQDWDANNSLWLDSNGQPPMLATDPSSPAGPTVMQLTRVSSGVDYLSPFIGPYGGTLSTYCLHAKIKWVSGGAPRVGVLARYLGSLDFVSAFGGPSYDPNLGDPSVLSAVATGWQDLAHDMPGKYLNNPVDYLQLAVALTDGASKGGEPLAYFDGFALDDKPCSFVTLTRTATQTGTLTVTSTRSDIVTDTQTLTATLATTGTATATQTLVATDTQTGTGTISLTSTLTETSTAIATATQLGDNVLSYTQTYELSGILTSTNTAIVRHAIWPHRWGRTATATTTHFRPGTASIVATATVTGSLNGTDTKTASASITVSWRDTDTATVTVTATRTSRWINAGWGAHILTETNSANGTATQSWTYHPTITVTTTETDSATHTATGSETVTSTSSTAHTQTETITVTETNVLTQTNTDSFTQYATTTDTATGTETVTRTFTVVGSNTSTNTTTLICPSGFADCDRYPENGCETNLLADPNHCGTCDISCQDNNACTIDQCNAGACAYPRNAEADAQCGGLASYFQSNCRGRNSVCNGPYLGAGQYSCAPTIASQYHDPCQRTGTASCAGQTIHLIHAGHCIVGGGPSGLTCMIMGCGCADAACAAAVVNCPEVLQACPGV